MNMSTLLKPDLTALAGLAFGIFVFPLILKLVNS